MEKVYTIAIIILLAAIVIICLCGTTWIVAELVQYLQAI